MQSKSKIKINATGKAIGRLASEVASLLYGKDSVSFDPSKVEPRIVIIEHLSEAIITGNKEEKKKYYRHSGYIGSLKEASFGELWKKDNKKLFVKMVGGMLPKNKLRNERLKNLRFEDNNE